MKLISRFVFLEDPDRKNENLILDTYTMVVGQVWMFKTQQELDEFYETNRFGKFVAMVSGYRILITVKGALNDDKISDQTIRESIHEMVIFYGLKRIHGNHARYERYKN